MSVQTHQASRRWLPGTLLAALSLALVLTGCAQVLPTTYGVAPSPEPTLTAPSAPVLTPTPSAPATPAKPVDPFDTVSAKTKAEFKGCLPKRIGPNSSGKCAKLVVKKLKAAGYYPWASTSVINVSGANAILNYQRSRGLKATATTTKETWVALATKAAALPVVLPNKCKTTKGIILCVDQAHRKLFWIKNGLVVKTFKVRLGGWNYLAKKHKWKIYATANGTWKVYDKQVDPKSENYGSGAMPYATMFYPDMYVHYSPGFHSVGYAMSSHGCVNIGQLSQAQWIFAHTPIGATVYVFSPKAAAVSTQSSEQPKSASPSATPTS